MGGPLHPPPTPPTGLAHTIASISGPSLDGVVHDGTVQPHTSLPYILYDTHNRGQDHGQVVKAKK